MNCSFKTWGPNPQPVRVSQEGVSKIKVRLEQTKKVSFSLTGTAWTESFFFLLVSRCLLSVNNAEEAGSLQLHQDEGGRAGAREGPSTLQVLLS